VLFVVLKTLHGKVVSLNGLIPMIGNLFVKLLKIVINGLVNPVVKRESDGEIIFMFIT
jgi:hypothetical protein